MTPSRPLSLLPRQLAAATAVAALAIAGCSGTGVDAQTNAQYQPGIGANVRTGPIQLFNALAVDNGNGTATFSASIINHDTTAAKLQSAKAVTSKGAEIKATTAPAIIAPGRVFNAGKAAAVILAGKKLAAGQYVDVTLVFDGGRKVSVEAPVVARNATYDGVASGPGGEVAKPTATPTPAAAEPAPAAAEPAAH